jgi:hypothetical protein
MSTMTTILNISGTTTDDQIYSAIPFCDMRAHAVELRDAAAAVIDVQGCHNVAHIHDMDGILVLHCPIWEYAMVNERSPGVGDSLMTDNWEAPTPAAAAAIWRGEDA